jgi:hypothetical protein
MKGHRQPEVRPSEAQESGSELAGGIMGVDHLNGMAIAEFTQSPQPPPFHHGATPHHVDRIEEAGGLFLCAAELVEATQVRDTTEGAEVLNQRRDGSTASATGKRQSEM